MRELDRIYKYIYIHTYVYLYLFIYFIYTYNVLYVCQMAKSAKKQTQIKQDKAQGQ